MSTRKTTLFYALLISVSAAMVVSRVGKERDIGSMIGRQVFGSSRVIGITAGVVTALGLIPGMPHLVFLSMASLIGYYAWWLAKRQREAAAQPVATKEDPAPQANAEATWDDLVPVDVLALEVGYRLIPLVDRAQEGALEQEPLGVQLVLEPCCVRPARLAGGLSGAQVEELARVVPVVDGLC